MFAKRKQAKLAAAKERQILELAAWRTEQNERAELVKMGRSMMEGKPDPKCLTCRHFEDFSWDTDGECRLNPPQGIRGGFPRMQGDDWCSRWEARP